MGKVVTFAYGIVSYVFSLVVFAYLAAFIGGFLVPNTLDGAPRMSLAWAILIDAGLIVLFGLQHSVMARPEFKRAWTKFVPKPAERSTYLLFTNIALIAMFAFWEPMGGVVWNIENATARTSLYALYAAGWLLVLAVTFLINHFDLFGLRQVWLHLRGREYTQLSFVTPGPYKHVRHPLYIGWFIVFWSTPTMTASHLLFAIGTTLYILTAIRFEERDLVSFHGKRYQEYREKTPMLVPQLSPVRLEGSTVKPARESGVV